MPTQTSQLVSNLQTIYNTKLQIKAAIGTNSDDFTQYPSLIEAAIEGGGGSSSVKVDPWYGAANINSMVEDEETTADYYKSCISDNFSATAVEEGGEPTGEYEDISWDEITEFEEGGETVEKIVHVVITGDPHEQSSGAGTLRPLFIDFPDLYDRVCPILEDVTLTVSEDPSNDGYDYLLEGSIYAFNLIDCMAGYWQGYFGDFAYGSDGYTIVGMPSDPNSEPEPEPEP